MQKCLLRQSRQFLSLIKILAILIKISTRCFRNQEANLKKMCQEKQKDPIGTVKIILKKNSVERLAGPNFKTYYKGTIAKTS